MTIKWVTALINFSIIVKISLVVTHIPVWSSCHVTELCGLSCIHVSALITSWQWLGFMTVIYWTVTSTLLLVFWVMQSFTSHRFTHRLIPSGTRSNIPPSVTCGGVPSQPLWCGLSMFVCSSWTVFMSFKRANYSPTQKSCLKPSSVFAF